MMPTYQIDNQWLTHTDNTALLKKGAQHPRWRSLLYFIALYTSVTLAAAEKSSALLSEQPITIAIKVNQAGYLPTAEGLVYPVVSGPLQLVDVVHGRTVAQLKAVAGEPLALPLGLASSWYQLRSATQQSVEFEIDVGVIQRTLAILLGAYRYQHAGQPLRDNYSGVQRPPAHLQDGLIAHTDEFYQRGDFFDGSGGWYDAGDYGKYVATTAITAARLLDAAQESTDPLQQALQQEALIGLRWLIKMQRRDGAFYRKIGGEQWPELVAPHQDRQLRYVYGVSTPDSAKAVAVLAQAARIFSVTEPDLAKRFLMHAQRGWRWLTLHPEQWIDWHQGDDNGSGSYIYNQWDKQPSLTHDKDDRFWAAVELYLTTQEVIYLQALQQMMPESVVLFEWKDPSVMGLWHLLMSPLLPELKAELSQQLLDHCQQLRQYAEQSEFHISNQRFIWGSNKMVAEEGILLSYCYRLSGQTPYLQLAQSQWNYLFGVNPFGLSYVTGVGQHRVRHLHHIWGRAVGFVPAGMLVGGPNQDAQAGFAPKGQGMRSYIDDAKDYSVNEFAIDYNAAAIGLAAMLHDPDGVQYVQSHRLIWSGDQLSELSRELP